MAKQGEKKKKQSRGMANGEARRRRGGKKKQSIGEGVRARGAAPSNNATHLTLRESSTFCGVKARLSMIPIFL